MHWIVNKKTQKPTTSIEYLNVDRIGCLAGMRRRQQKLRRLIQLQTQSINRKLGELCCQSDYFARYYVREQMVIFKIYFKLFLHFNFNFSGRQRRWRRAWKWNRNFMDVFGSNPTYWMGFSTLQPKSEQRSPRLWKVGHFFGFKEKGTSWDLFQATSRFTKPTVQLQALF